MAEKEDKLQIEVLDDAGQVIKEAEAVVIAPETELQAHDEKVKAELEKWQNQANEASRKSSELEQNLNDVVRYAQAQINENKRLTNLIASGEKVLVDQAGGRVKAEVAAADAAFKKAYEEGDTEAMLKAQKDIARLANEEAQVRSYQPVQQRQQSQQPPQFQQQQQPASDPNSKAWIDKNQEWWMKDRPMTGFALGLHEDLVRQGVKPGSDEYVKALDDGMVKAFPQKFGSQADQAPQIVRQRGVSVVAPATRTAAGKTTKVQISPSMASMARRLGVPIDKYAEEMARIENG